MVRNVMTYKVSASGLSDIGLVRQKNEDVWGQIPEHHIYILADGMGGHRSGDVAAREAVSALTRILKEKLPSLPDDQRTIFDVGGCIRQAIEEANRVVYELSKTDDSLKGMGTTLCCLHIHDEGLIYAHVGDSRIYRLRAGDLEQLTEDHSLLRELVAAGQIREQNAGDFVYKNIITKAIGTEPIVEPSVAVRDLESGDTFLLCSDGLSDLLQKDSIEEILKSDKDMNVIAQRLVDAAKARGGHDNITVVLIRVT
ncbi:MAG: Stp1/IreP family PP2C-type Ser/Thr phosphatase [Chlamydiales bacterium]|nr:Stp1/IreP family PP2C-type Ser/Thr phosphatase [Chlamydiales bacterium]